MNADYTVATDRLPNPGETVVGGDLNLLPGGKSGNQAAAAARLGAQVTMFGVVGSDDNADFLIRHLQEAGVDTSQIRHTEGVSGLAIITVDKTGQNTIVYSAGANDALDSGYVVAHKDAFASLKTLGLCLESPMESVMEAAFVAHQFGVKILLNDSPFISDIPEALVRSCDVLLVNEHEMADLLKVGEPSNGSWEKDNWPDISQRLHQHGFNQAIVTLGVQGSMVIDGSDCRRVRSRSVSALDTTGCGDAFFGTVLACLASDLNLYDSALVASEVAAYAATGMGAQSSYGTRDEIEKFIETIS